MPAVRALASAHHWECWPNAGRIEDSCRADLILVPVGPGTETIITCLKAAGLPTGWFGVTSKGAELDQVALLACDKKVFLLLSSSEEPDKSESIKLAKVFSRDGAAEIRMHFPGSAFWDEKHTSEEVAALWQKGQVLVVEESKKREPEDALFSLSEE